MDNIHSDQGKILYFTAFTEFGERYSYYVIQALLIFFLLDRFHISQQQSSSLVGTALGMVYISAILGGYIADKLLGYYRSALVGSVIMVCGCFILATSSSENLLFLGLAFISISTGLIKSNMSSFLGHFYDKSGLSDSHRDFGFNVFYVGINFGSLFALFFASFLKDHYGFAVPFYSSVIVTLFMVVNLVIGSFKLKGYIGEHVSSPLVLFKTTLIIIGYIALVFVTLKNQQIAAATIFVACVLCAVILFKSAQGKYWQNVAVALLFFILSILYWSLYFQLFISMLVFIDKSVSHQILDFTMGSSQFLAVESFAVVILGSLVGKIWLQLGKSGKPVSDIDKFNLGFVLIGLMFLFFFFAIKQGQPQTKLPAMVIAIGLIILAVSELCLSAIGLSMITKIAPKGYVSLYMGIWLVTLGIGGKVAGFLSSGIEITDNVGLSKLNMAHGFLIFAIMSGAGVLVCLVTRKKLQSFVYSKV